MRVCPRCGGGVGGEWACAACRWRAERRDGIVLFAPELVLAGAGFDRATFEALLRIEDVSFWFAARNELLRWAFGRHCGAAAHVLEIGVGTGFVLRALRQAYPRASFCGSDLFLEGLSAARRRLGDGVPLYQMDARQIPFREEFDAVCAFDILEHIEDDHRVLREVDLALRPGGVVMLTVPQHRFLWSPADTYAHHVRRYTRRELLVKVRAAGFRVVLVTSFVSLLFPALLIARLRTRREGAYDLAAEHRQGAAAATLLRGIMTVERAAIRRGLSFPVGGSLLVVAVKGQP